MAFSEDVKAFAAKVKQYIDQDAIKNEEATKTFIILPFLELLGYDTRNPLSFRPEFSANYEGVKQGDRVDYAIFDKGQPRILIEAKPVTEELSNHTGQLHRYFGATNACLGILTNGLIYKFFTDLDKVNTMDSRPFFELDLLKLKDVHLKELEKFHRTKVNFETISNDAISMRYLNAVKQFMRDQMDEPSDDFVYFLLKNVFQQSLVTKKQVEMQKETVRKSLTSFVGELVEERIQKLLAASEQAKEEDTDEAGDAQPEDNGIVTTDKEFGAFYVLRSVLSDVIDPERIKYKDTKSYFGVLLDGNTRKWICRLSLDGSTHYIGFPKEDKQSERYPLEKISDIRLHRDKLIEITKRLMA